MNKLRFAAAALAFVFAASFSVFAQESDQLMDDSTVNNAHAHFTTKGPKFNNNGQAHARWGVAGLDSLANFNRHYFTPGFDSNNNPQNEWYTNTVGNPPEMGGTTVINAPVIPVSVDLRNADGTPRFVNGKRLYYDVTPYIAGILNSPVFQNSTYSSSSTPTQFTDAVQRAEFYKEAKPDWHTVLAPSVKTPRVITLLRGTYAFSLNADGSCCRYILVEINTFENALFPATVTDTTTPIGAAEHAGEMTTKDMSSFIFPNTYLYFGNTANCCVLGFHSFDFEPGDASNGNTDRAYVVNYSSWISPGLFGAGFQDVTAHSHEIAESFNDPFVAFDGVHDQTPWWLSPNGNCQNNLEDGDVIEGLPGATYPVTLNGFTYHPQNESLLQWFRFEQQSSAIDGAYSYPNELLLTAPSAIQHAGCQ
jgi:hypothetical protein